MTVDLRPAAEWSGPPSARSCGTPARRPPIGGNALAELIRVRSSGSGSGDHTYVAEARGRRRLSFRGLDRAVTAWAAHFGALGVAPGARVGVAVADPLDFAVVYLALMASGRWAAPLDPHAPAEGPGGVGAALSRLDLSSVIADRARPSGAGAGWIDLRDGALPDAPVGPVAPGSGSGGSGGADPGGFVPPVGADAGYVAAPDAGGALLASSGTTGVPKVISLPVEQLLCAARAVAGHHRLTPDDRGFCPLPLFHVNAEVVGLLSSLVAGSALVLDDRFHRTGFWELMARLQVTWVNAVPAIVSHLATLGPDETVPPGIRFVRSASAPLPAATLSRFESATGIPVLETYGMTEAASQITANPLEGLRKPGTVGLPVGVELRIVPDGALPGGIEPAGPDLTGPGCRLEPGLARTGPGGSVVGHVEIRGPSVIAAYEGGHHADRFDREGWLRTGDLGYLDDDGYLTLVGRSDDVINRGGEKVFPREIEEVVLADPDVADVAVVGEDDPVFGQVPVAFVTLGTGVATGPAVLARLRAALDAAVVRAKRPVAVHVVADLPRGPTGKVQRRAVRERRPEVLHSLSCR